MIKLAQVSVPTDAQALRKSRTAFQSLLKRNDLGFHQLPGRDEVWTSSRHYGQWARDKFSKMVVLGIGGSSLGGRVVQDGLAPWSGDRLHFFENVDSRRFWDRLRSLPALADTCWVIVSKSGGTMETLSQVSFLDQYLRGHGLTLANSCLVVSDPGANPLTEWADQNQVPRLMVPPDVGGRFSILTPVGLLPSQFLGVPLEKLRTGAKWAGDQEELISQLAAQSLMSFGRQEWITLFWFYSDLLKTMGLWVQQLWAESLAKKLDRSGGAAPRVSTPVPLVGANDQHSVLQQVMEGGPDKFTWFIRVLDAENFGPTLGRSLFKGHDYLVGKSLGALFQAEALATQAALGKHGRQSLTLSLNQVDAESLGALFQVFELVVGTIGEMHNINAFDQPGVELGKRLAKEMLIK